MIKEFLENVQRLYDETVQDKSVRTNQSAADLLDVLLRKVTQPIQVFKDNTCVHAIYYNVSVSLANNLSSMDIAYNSDYQMTFHDLTSCDLHQLSEFILALERDIPKWRHIWVADDKLRKEKAKIGERVVSSLQQFRYDLMSGQMHDDEKRIERFRIKYYNLKACKMCLDNDNPFWENKKTEAEILEECRTLHMDPPMEQWYSDFTDFVDGCKQMRDERDRKREEQKRELEKLCHLVRIKKLKLEALINAIELHDHFNVTVEQRLLNIPVRFFSRRPIPSKDGHFVLLFKINDASTRVCINFNDVDRSTPAIISAIKRINDMIPELHHSLIEDGSQYYLAGEGMFWVQRIDDLDIPFTVVSSQQKRAIPSPDLASSRVVNRINAAIRELKH